MYFHVVTTNYAIRNQSFTNTISSQDIRIVCNKDIFLFDNKIDF